MTLLFLVRYQTISLIDTKVEPRQGSAEYLELKFLFATPDWASLRKTLHLSSGEFSEPYILESDTFRVPTYYTQQNSFCITLLGDSGNTLVPTNVLEISLSASNKLWQAAPPDPQNSVYVQLLQQLAEYEDRLSALEQGGGSGGGGGITKETDPTVPAWAKQPNPPSSPTPHKLTFTGAVTAEYDGSEAVSVEIPQGGSGGGIEVTGASVGQTIVVKAVDDNGKPTEWETRDFPDSSQNVELDTTLTLKDGVLSVNTVNQIIEDDPRPVTSGAVYEEFSKAVALLNTI